MLSFPRDGSAKRLVKELFRIKETCPAIVAWLKEEEQILHRMNTMMKDTDILRWNQGALQLLSSLFKHVLEARDTYERLTKGD